MNKFCSIVIVPKIIIYVALIICCFIFSSCVTTGLISAACNTFSKRNTEKREKYNPNYESIKPYIDELGKDNYSMLNQKEGDYFNILFGNRLNGFDFINKRVLFLDGHSGLKIIDKQTMFNNVKDCLNNNITPLSVSSQLLVSSENFSQKTGYDAVVTQRMKNRITEKYVMKILKKKRINVSPDYVKQETLICVQSKIISSGTMSFLRKKEDKCELLSFSYRIDIKRHTAYCTLREKSIYDISDKTILHYLWLTSAEFRRCKYYDDFSEKNYNCFADNFLDLNNDDKIKVMEAIASKSND